MIRIVRFAEDLIGRFNAVGTRVIATANLGLGAVIAIANGSALVLTLGSRHSMFADRVWQMAALAIVGGAMFVLSLPMLLSREWTPSILKVQSCLIIGFTIALILLGLDMTFSTGAPKSKFVWSFGLLTLLGAYSGVLGARVFMNAMPLRTQSATLTLWVAVVLAFDLLTALRAGS